MGVKGRGTGLALGRDWAALWQRVELPLVGLKYLHGIDVKRIPTGWLQFF